MSTTATIQYLGGLRTEPTHTRSGNSFITDAPVDNNGKGEAFSPTDLLATSLGACMITVMGIEANKRGFDLENTTVEVVKSMAVMPRRISKVEIVVSLKANCDADTQKDLEKIGRNCPVAKSLSSELVQDITFHWI